MKTPIRDATHDFLEAISHGLLVLEMNGRYRWAYIREGRDGIRRVLASEERREVVRRLYEAKKRGLISESKIGKRLTLSLTGKGLETFGRKAMDVARPREDGRHVCVMYDIPEKFRSLRDQLRRILKRAGFTLFQQSVWRTDRDIAPLLKEWVRRHKLEKWVDISIT